MLVKLAEKLQMKQPPQLELCQVREIPTGDYLIDAWFEFALVES